MTKLVIEIEAGDAVAARDKYDELLRYDDNIKSFRSDTGGMVNLPVRETLKDFAVAMERKLKKNDHKNNKGKNTPLGALIKLMKIEVAEFDCAFEHFSHGDAQDELVDIANFAMLLHGRLGEKVAAVLPKDDGISGGVK